MRIRRHFEAQHHDLLQRWELENELVRPYASVGLTTRTAGTSFVRRAPSGAVVVITPSGTRVLGQ